MEDNTIIVVTGLQRSGTSLMMQILQAAGLPLYIDDKQQPNEHNPKGYYEHHKVKYLQNDVSFLEDTIGKCVKIFALQIPNLPKKYNYKFINMERDTQEVLSSIHKKYNLRSDFLPAPKLARFELIIETSKQFISTLPNAEMLTIDFKKLVTEQTSELNKLKEFLSIKTDNSILSNVIDKTLYKRRGLVGLIRTDRAPREIYKFIEKYSKDKIFCEIGIGEGYNLNAMNNPKEKFGIETLEYGVNICKTKYPHLKVHLGDALDLIPKYPFEVCYLWIVYPVNRLIVNKVLEYYPNCTIVMGINYMYHLKEDDPKYKKYMALYTEKASAKNWNKLFDEHREELESNGRKIEIHQIKDVTNEIFSIAVITKGNA